MGALSPQFRRIHRGGAVGSGSENDPLSRGRALRGGAENGNRGERINQLKLVGCDNG